MWCQSVAPSDLCVVFKTVAKRPVDTYCAQRRDVLDTRVRWGSHAVLYDAVLGSDG